MADEHEALRSHVAVLRDRAQAEFIDDLLNLIAELRTFGGAAAQAIGEISVEEAWGGIERVFAAFIAKRSTPPPPADAEVVR